MTEQFYRWEQRGRGWHVFQSPVELEPVFDPFFGHYLAGEIIDDGRRPRWWQRLGGATSDELASVNPYPVEALAYENEETVGSVIYAVAIPRNYTANPNAIEQLLTMLALSGQTVSFELIATSSIVALQFTCKHANAYWLYTQLKGYLPECAVSEAHEDQLTQAICDANAICTVDFGLAEEFMRPTALYEGKGGDPYTALFGIIDHLQADEGLVLQTLFCGSHNPWAESIMASVSDSRGDSFFYDSPEMPALAREKTSRPLAGATVRVACMSDDWDGAYRLITHSVMAIQQASRSPHNAVMALASPHYDLGLRLADIVLRQSHRLGMLLNVRELATFVHVPNAGLSKKLLASNRTTKRAPTYLDNPDYILGINEHQGQKIAVGIDTIQRTRHIHVLGGSGVGKSTLLHSLIAQDIENGTGCCVLDPHGDLIENVLKAVPNERIKDVVLIDPSDSGCPVGFNVLSAHSDLERELLASDLVALFRRFSTSWGDNLHSTLANAIMAFLYNTRPGHLGDLRRFLIEPAYRKEILSTCTDDELKYYWHTEYPLVKSSSIGSILTRLDGFLRPRIIRNMVCQHRGLDFGALMDSNKIVLVKLSQGLIGAENSHLLGACIVAKLQQCAMARQQQATKDRVPFFCYIDEFHHFVTESMGAILSGARKFNFGLVLAHQDMQQVQRNDPDIAGALMANVATRVCFKLSDTDAKRMQEGFSGFGADDLQNLGVGEAIVRVNTADCDFNITISPMDTEYRNRDEVIAYSREQYSVRVSPIEHTSPPPEPVSEPKPLPPPQPPRTVAPEPEAVQQKAVREHRYLQTFIKAMAEQNGYKASIEVPTPDGNGLIDVALQKGKETIAVEVSVSTGAEWELHNVQKCLGAKYGKVVVCSSSEKKLQQIRNKIAKMLSAPDQARIQLLTPDQIPTLFAAPATQEPTEKVMKGYRVKVKFEEGANGPVNEDIIKRIIKNRP